MLDGPESAGGYVWREVQFDAGYTGWSVGNGLEEIWAGTRLMNSANLNCRGEDVDAVHRVRVR